MTLWTRWSGRTCGILVAVCASACSFDAATDPMDDDGAGESLAALGPNACTAVTMTSPGGAFTAELGQAIPLQAVATCPDGQTPEYQFWVKKPGAPRFSIVGPYMLGGTTWTPSVTGTWQVQAVTRAVGSTDAYQARSATATGTVSMGNHPPIANDDSIVTVENHAGAVDVFGNDSDPEGDEFAISSHTNPTHGMVVFLGSVATYTPGSGYIGADSFTYTIMDAHGRGATATVSVQVNDQPPLVADDVIATFAGMTGTTNVLANDLDPDGDQLTITSYTQGAHGTVQIVNGIASYTPAAGFEGNDGFTYTVDDGHGLAATGTVNVSVEHFAPACTIEIIGPPTGTYGQNLHLSASAVCTTGPAEVAWLKRINNQFIVIRPFNASPELDFTADTVGLTTFMAIARTKGFTPTQARSGALNVRIADNVDPCTAVRVTSPTWNAQLPVGMPVTLTATAACPAGATPEYQFWVRVAGAPNWTMLPGYTTGAGSWTPPATGNWYIRAVVRTTDSHVNYQAGSSGLPVTVTP